MPSASQKAAAIAQKINYRLERLIPVTTPLGIIAGLLLPAFFINFRPYVPWLFAVITFSGALKLRASELTDVLRKPLSILLVFVCSHVIMPAAAMFSSSAFFSNTDIVAGFVLLFAGPTAVSGFIWVIIFRGNKALALTLILLDTLLAPLVVPLTLSLLIGEKTALDMGGITFSLVMMIVVPTIIGVAVNETSRRKIPLVVSPYLDPFSKLCLLLVIAANASSLASMVRFTDPIVWKTAAVCIILTTAGFLLVKTVTVIGKIDKDNAIGMIFSGGLRNNSAVMTIAVTFFPEAAALPSLLSIMFQHVIAAIVGNIITRKKNLQ